MKYTLCIETATTVCSVALFADGKLLSIREDDSGKSHSRLLTVFIQDILEENGISTSNLDYVVFGDGPGSYTGLRIGAAVAKTLCYVNESHFIAVSSLSALSYASWAGKTEKTPHMACFDARRDDLYFSIRDSSGKEVEMPGFGTLDDTFLSKLAKYGKQIQVSGNCFKKVSVAFPQEKWSDVNFRPSAEHLFPLASQMIDNQVFTKYYSFSPNYLQAPNITSSKKTFDFS